MGMMIVRHKVADYAKWRPIFDAHVGKQKAAGLTNPQVLRSADDKSELVIVFNDASTKDAKAFANSADLKDTMKNAGVTDRPTIYFLEAV